MCPPWWIRFTPAGLDSLSLGCRHRCAKLSRAGGNQGKSSRTASDEERGYPSLEKVGVFRAGNRPCLIMDAAASFNLEVQSAADPGNSEVRAWQRLTLRFQGASPRVTPGRKWVPMRRMLSLAHRNAAAAEAAVHRNPSVVRASQAGLAHTEARTLGRGRAELLAFREATPSIARAADRHRARRLK